jgi:hypothetical protein
MGSVKTAAPSDNLRFIGNPYCVDVSAENESLEVAV